MWWLVMLLKCCLQSWVHWFANCQTQNLAKTICCRKKHGKNPSIQLSPFKRAPFKGKWHKPCKSKAMCMHLKWNQCIHVCLSVWARCIFLAVAFSWMQWRDSSSSSWSKGGLCDDERLVDLQLAHYPFSSYTCFSADNLVQDETACHDCDVFRWNIFMAANTKYKRGLYFLQKGWEIESTLKQTNWIQLRLPIKPIICWNSDNQNFKTLWRGEASNKRPSKQSI